MIIAMSKSNVVARVLEGDRLECQVESQRGEILTLTGRTTDVEPTLDGSSSLAGNHALVHNAWAYAKFTYLKVNLPSKDEQKGAEKRAKTHHEVAEWITDLVDDLERTTKGGWCSGCFVDTDHQKVRNPPGPLPAYLCTNCGSPTLPCADPRCDNMAERVRGTIRAPRYCAEHRHDIPGFAKAGDQIGSLGDYAEFLEYDKAHLGPIPSS
jgi:hypothetical protein